MSDPDSSIQEALDALIHDDPRYPKDAYLLILEALRLLIEQVQREEHTLRHLSGRELTKGILLLAMESFGPTAIDVFHSWSIYTTRDLGEIVFAMIRVGMLAKTDKDRLSDFEDVCDLEEALGLPFRPPSFRDPSSLNIPEEQIPLYCDD